MSHANQRPAQTLLLGTFHLADKGRDVHKPQHHFDVAARQGEIEEVLEYLAAFAPTKVAVEFDALRRDELERNYQAYLRDDFALTDNEIHQFGFRLAKRLKLPQVHAINAWGRFYDPPIDGDLEDTKAEPSPPFNPYEVLEALAHQNGQEALLGEIDSFFAHFAELDKRKVRQPLRQTLLEINDPKHVVYLHGVYLVAHFKVGSGVSYPGADAATAWYNRNLRIFANLQRVTTPGDRILVIYGLGHTSILRHCLEASPDYDLLEVSTYL